MKAQGKPKQTRQEAYYKTLNRNHYAGKCVICNKPLGEGYSTLGRKRVTCCKAHKQKLYRQRAEAKII